MCIYVCMYLFTSASLKLELILFLFGMFHSLSVSRTGDYEHSDSFRAALEYKLTVFMDTALNILIRFQSYMDTN
jgi:hypothetical protein